MNDVLAVVIVREANVEVFVFALEAPCMRLFVVSWSSSMLRAVLDGGLSKLLDVLTMFTRPASDSKVVR